MNKNPKKITCQQLVHQFYGQRVVSYLIVSDKFQNLECKTAVVLDVHISKMYECTGFSLM